MGIIHDEPIETLGDTTPGAFDQLPLLEHPAVLEAREATRLPRSRWFLLLAVLVLVAVTLPACGGGDCDADCQADFQPPPLDCKARPELCI